MTIKNKGIYYGLAGIFVAIFICLFGANFLYAQSTTTTPVLTGYCSVNVTPDVDASTYQIYWDSNVYGNASSPSFSWTGSDGLSASTQSVNKTYSGNGLRTGNVRIQTDGEAFVLNCSADTQRGSVSSTNDHLGGYCSSSASGMTVTWTASIYGGDITTPYNYMWSGTDGLTASSTSYFAEKTYTTEGIKNARVEVTSGGERLALQCGAKIASTTNSGCFIATAAYGTEMEPEVMALRHFRDDTLLQNELGERFVEAYYKISPTIADFIRDKEYLKAVVRSGLKPIVWMVEY